MCVVAIRRSSFMCDIFLFMLSPGQCAVACARGRCHSFRTALHQDPLAASSCIWFVALLCFIVSCIFPSPLSPLLPPRATSCAFCCLRFACPSVSVSSRIFHALAHCISTPYLYTPIYSCTWLLIRVSTCYGVSLRLRYIATVGGP